MITFWNDPSTKWTSSNWTDMECFCKEEQQKRCLQNQVDFQRLIQNDWLVWCREMFDFIGVALPEKCHFYTSVTAIKEPPLLNLANRCFISDTSGNKNDHNYIFLPSTCMFDWFLLCVHWPGALVQIRGSIVGSSLQVLKLSIYMTCIYGMFRRGWNKALFLTTWPVLPADFIKSNYLRSSHKNSFIIHIQRAVITNGLMRTPFDILD